MGKMRGLVLLLAVLAGVVSWTWWNSDRRQIGRQFDRLIDRIEKSAGEGQLAAAFKAEEATSVFATPFSFRAHQFDFETQDRQALMRAIALYRGRSDRISVDVLDDRLDIDSAARKATLIVTARFVGGWQGRPGEAYRFQFNWVEQDGEWKIDYANLDEIVQASIFLAAATEPRAEKGPRLSRTAGVDGTTLPGGLLSAPSAYRLFK